MATQPDLDSKEISPKSSNAQKEKVNVITPITTTTIATTRTQSVTQDDAGTHGDAEQRVEWSKHGVKRPRASNGDSRAEGPLTVTIVRTRGKHGGATIHSRPSKRPRTSYQQAYLYLDPLENYQRGSASHEFFKPTYRDSKGNAALGIFLAKWMTTQILGSEPEIGLKTLDRVNSRSFGQFEGILKRFNPSSAAVFLAMHYVERGVSAGLSFRSGFSLNLSMKSSSGPTIEQLVLYNVWIFLVALLAATSVISNDRTSLRLWGETMHLEEHHIKTMHRQFVMMLDDQLTIPLDDWHSFIHSLVLLNEDKRTHNTFSARSIVGDILADESRGCDTSHSRFVMPLSITSGCEEPRAPEDIQHVATVLAILLTHTINVTFDWRGVPCGRGKVGEKKTMSTLQRATAASVQRLKEEQAKAKPTDVQATPVFTPPPAPTTTKEGHKASRSDDEVDDRNAEEEARFSFGYRGPLDKKPSMMIIPIDGTMRSVAISKGVV
ncbi:hypothetical protein L218DRAFT_716097 [Marasmius fiardii PR-910]|nr:hypothetical protein L218DRAFT_716097 [Marasmius fiardii PR-910]